MEHWRSYASKLDLLGLMLLGLYVGRRGAVWNADIRQKIARQALPWLIGVGFGGCLIWVAMQNFGMGDSSSLAHTMIRKSGRLASGHECTRSGIRGCNHAADRGRTAGEDYSHRLLPWAGWR